MDSCCAAALKANANPAVSNRNTGFWGGSVKGSLKSGDLNFGSRVWKNLRTEKINKNVTKPGVAYSILTSDTNKETVVSTRHAFNWSFSFLGFVRNKPCLSNPLMIWNLIQTFQAPMFETPQADPKNVAAIILGGGAGTRLFPLTNRRAKPAVK